MNKTYRIAVVGVTGLVGETALALLAERGFPVSEVFALDVKTATGGRVGFKDAYLRVQDLAAFDFTRADLAFFCIDEALAAEHAPRAAAAGCVVIDDSAQFRLDEDVPLVVPEVNPQTLAGFNQRRIIANPNTGVTLMSLVLKPLHDVAGIERINVCTYQAVSGTGKAAVDELAGQSAAIFNMKPLKSRIYPKQIAFNVLPQIGELLDNGYTREEMKMLWETRKVLAAPDLRVNATTVRVPVFYGHGLALHLETRDKLAANDARRLLKKTAGVKVLDTGKTGGYPTPVTEAAGKDAVYVGRLREDHSHPRGLALWIVADNVRKGSALNGIQIAEILVKDYLN